MTTPGGAAETSRGRLVWAFLDVGARRWGVSGEAE